MRGYAMRMAMLTAALVVAVLMAAGGLDVVEGAALSQSRGGHHGGGRIGHGPGMMGGWMADGWHARHMTGFGWGHMAGMSDACAALIDDPELRDHMREMMFSGDIPSVEECEEWMDELGIPPELQEECLEHMEWMASRTSHGRWGAAAP